MHRLFGRKCGAPPSAAQVEFIIHCQPPEISSSAFYLLSNFLLDKMSTYAKVPTAFNLQLDSRLCQAPTEIRQTIYAHLIAKNFHVSLHRGQLRLSACIDHYRRWLCVDGIWNSDSGRSWGPHWKCSDIALGKPRNEDKHEIITTLQLICKSM